MMLLARTGRIEAAVAQFDTCLTVLERELGTTPTIETEQVLARILALQRTRLHPLPAPTTTFVGREAESEEISMLLRARASRLLTLSGPGGIGKTRLAVQVVRLLAENNIRYFLHGIAFVAAGRMDSSNALVVAIADVLGLTLQQGGDPVAQLLGFLRDKELLLVLDEFEQILNAETLDFVLQLLAHSPNLTLLVTSREALNTPVERLYPLAGLTASASTQLTDPSFADTTIESAATRLFLETARRVQPAYTASEQTTTAIDKLCRLVDGMPLAIELAAAWSTVLTPEEIAAEIQKSLDFLGSDPSNRPARHASMRAVIESSWRHLIEVEQEVLQRLSVLQGSFTRQAAIHIGDATDGVLLGLVSKSFLQRSASGRLDMHPLLRQYAAEALERMPGRLASTRERHSTYFATKLARWATDAKGAQQIERWSAISCETENCSAAWTWAVTQERIDLLLLASDGIGLLYERVGAFEMGERAFQAASWMPCLTNGTRSQRTAQHRILQSKILIWEARFADSLGQTQQAIKRFRVALTMLDDEADQLGADTELRRAAGYLHLTYAHLLRHTERALADEHYDKSVSIFVELNDQWGLSQAYLGQCGMAREYGNYRQAEIIACRSLDIARQLEDVRSVADATSRLALIHMDLGNLGAARDFHGQTLKIYYNLGDTPKIAGALDMLGLLGLFQGEFEIARRQFEESLILLESLGARRSIGLVTTWLGVGLAVDGQYERGHAHGKFALAIAEEASDLFAEGHARMLLGYTSVLLGNSADALDHLETSREIFGELGQKDELGQAHAYLAYTTLARGEWQNAQSHLIQALQLASTTHTILPVLLAVPAVAHLFVIREELEMAIELWSLATTHPMIANASMMDDLAGRHVRAVFGLLPKAVVDAAKERGWRRDLHMTAEELLTILASSGDSAA